MKLLDRVPSVAKIIGEYSMDERRKQVDYFRNESQIMLATDAGGESINLQFCNQMINYDIPWNPNRLEQRMGRIHRIGQKNEVFAFNLVAENTREGNVMIRLIEKMERMRIDLGSDLVYDFIGEVLEDRYDNLANLMQEAIINREKLDDIINDMERSLSEDHENLLKLVQEEKLVEDTIDLPHLKKEQNDIAVHRVPKRGYAAFIEHIFKMRKVRVYESNDGYVQRIERLPKFIRDNALKENIHLDFTEAVRFTGYQEYEDKNTFQVDIDSPVLKLGLSLTKKELDKYAIGRYMVSYPVSETLSIECYLIGIKDGTGEMLINDLVFLAKRVNGQTIEVDPYWLFQNKFTGEGIHLNADKDTTLKSDALKKAIISRGEVKGKREKQLNKMKAFLDKTYRVQYDETLQKLEEYQRENIDNKNSALINQMNAKLIDIENKKEERLSSIERQANISMIPPKLIVQLEVTPNGKNGRLISTDYQEVVEEYEKANGRRNVKAYAPFALVDFASEHYSGEERFIIITDRNDFFLDESYLEDLREIKKKVYVYIVIEGKIALEKEMANYLNC